MHISEADKRRRDGESSWQEYGWEASKAEGKGRFARITGKRDENGRLAELSGLWLGDLRLGWFPKELEKLESALWEWRRGDASREEAASKMKRIFRDGHRPSLFTEEGRREYRKPTNSREFHEKFGHNAFRLSLYRQAGVDPGVSGFPLLEAWLADLRSGIRARLRGAPRKERDAPLLDELIEEATESGVNLAARKTGLFEELPPGFEA